MMRILTFLTLAGSAALFSSLSASAAVVLATGIEGHHQGDSPAGGDGSHTRAIDGSGLTKPDVNNPATWTHSNAWQDDWQGFNANFADPNANFAVLNLGTTVTNLDKMYLWNVNEGSHTNRGVQNFEIFFATTPTLLPGATSGTNQTYSFSSGGWTQIGGTHTLSAGTGVAGLLPDTFDISGAAAGAQYIGIRMNSYYANDVNRVGLSEVAFTTIPEPSAPLLMLVGGIAILRRRHRSA